MATERTWVLIRHDGGYGDRLVPYITAAIQNELSAVVVESSAPYDEMLSLADSKRLLDHVLNLFKHAEEMNAKICVERDKALEDMEAMRVERDKLSIAGEYHSRRV